MEKMKGKMTVQKQIMKIIKKGKNQGLLETFFFKHAVKKPFEDGIIKQCIHEEKKNIIAEGKEQTR